MCCGGGVGWGGGGHPRVGHRRHPTPCHLRRRHGLGRQQPGGLVCAARVPGGAGQGLQLLSIRGPDRAQAGGRHLPHGGPRQARGWAAASRQSAALAGCCDLGAPTQQTGAATAWCPIGVCGPWITTAAEPPGPQPAGAQPAAACWDDLRPAGPRPCAGVYTRNRAFRLLLSSKFGKEACLAPTGRWGDRHMTMQQLFFASLVTHLPEGAADSQHLDGASTSRPGSACGVHRQRTMRHHTGQPTLLHMAPAAPAAGAAACRASSGGAAAAAGLPAAWQHLLLAWPSMAAAAGATGAPTAASSAGPAPAGASAGGAGGSGQALAPGAPMCPALPGPSPYASLEAFITSQCNQVRRRAWGAAAGFQEGLLMQWPGRGAVLSASSGPDCLHQCLCLHCCRAASRGG